MGGAFEAVEGGVRRCCKPEDIVWTFEDVGLPY